MCQVDPVDVPTSRQQLRWHLTNAGGGGEGHSPPQTLRPSSRAGGGRASACVFWPVCAVSSHLSPRHPTQALGGSLHHPHPPNSFLPNFMP